jgi:glucose dehydrogenase
MRRHRVPGGLVVVLVLASAVAQEKSGLTISAKIDLQPADLLAQPVGVNWVSYNGDYSGRRFSSLAEITPENVDRLRAQWVFHIRDSTGLEVTPVVVDGVMFVTSANDAFALDARTGRSIWHYSRPITEGLIDDASQHHNRGVAIWHSHVFLETDNAHLLCLDARSGHLLWDVTYAEGNKNYGATSAPLVIKDKVLVGTSGGDDGVRGFIAAFDAESGKLAWRFWTIPGPGEPGSSSWPGQMYLRGGGTTQNSTPFIGAPVILRPILTARRVPETISTQTASWLWIPTSVSSNGIFNSRRTTCSISMPRKLRFCSIRPTAVSPENSWSKPIAMAFSTSSIVRTENFSRPSLLSRI